MLKKPVITALVGATVAISVVGCVSAPIQPRADPYVAPQISLTSDDLRNKTAVSMPVVTRDSEGQLVNVTVPIRAATDLQLYIDYRITFLDASGQVIYQSGWLNQTLPPNVQSAITFNSMTPRAADFRLDIRYAQ